MNRALRPDKEVPTGLTPLESPEPWQRGAPDIGESANMPSKFNLEPWSEITFDSSEEWLVKRFLQRRGVAVIYGKPASFKSFLASHIALCCALGWNWAARSVFKASVVYIAAEGASGHRKRKAAYVKAYPDLPTDIDFALVSAAPNLGAESGDLPALIDAIKRANYSPGLIVLDTLAQTLGSGDENGAGMTVFLTNAGKLAEHFQSLVLIVHHVGHANDKRMRGHSSLGGGVDAQILCERQEGALEAALTVVKLKDEASDVRFTARLSRVVLGHDQDGDEISTLIVDGVDETHKAPRVPTAKSIPPQQRLLMAVVVDAIDEAGEMFSPFGADGPRVRGVADSLVRARYYSRIAEQADPDEDRKKLAERQRKAFNNAVRDALKAERLFARERDGRRFIWLP
jgi:AAA domain